MHIIQRTLRPLAVLLFVFTLVFVSNVFTSHAASSLTSISFANIIVNNNNCAAGTAVYRVEVVVNGTANAGTFTIIEHFSGSGGSPTASILPSDALLGTTIDLGTTLNGTGWTAPNDIVHVYVEATANGFTVTTPVIEIDCAAATYTILASSTPVTPVTPSLDAPRPPDDRLNWQFGDNTAVIYARSDAAGNPTIHLYCVDGDSKGQLALIVTQADLEEIAPLPDANQLVAESSVCAVHFYVLTTGEYQINIGPDAEGKTAVIIFTELTAQNVYASWVTP